MSRELAGRYDDALADVDVLAMPTTPQTAHAAEEELTRLEVIERALDMLANTCPFDVTAIPPSRCRVTPRTGCPSGSCWSASGSTTRRCWGPLGRSRGT